MAKKIVLWVILFLCQACSNLLDTPSKLGVWSLVSSTDKEQEYYQIKIEKEQITRLFEHGNVLIDKNTIKGNQVMLMGYPLNIELLQADKLRISDDTITHIFQRIELIEDCFCTDCRFFSKKFNYLINATNPNDSLKINQLKNEMWAHFSGDIHFEEDLKGLEDIIIEFKE